MTDNDEETKAHPVFPDAPPPVEPIQGDLVPPPAMPVAPGPADFPMAEATPAESTPVEPATGEPMSVDAPPPPLPSIAPPSIAPPPIAPAPAAPLAVDPLEPTTTVHVVSAPPVSPTPPPSQAWSGPPPGAANLPGQWQSPGYGQPGYGAPAAYPAAQPYGAAAPTYGTSVFVALSAMLLVIMGIALAVLGAWLLTQGPALSDLVQRLRSVDLVVFKPTRELLRSVVSAFPGTLMVLGVLQLLVGVFVLGHRGWARWLGVLIGLLGLLFSVVALTSTMALIPGTSVQLILSISFLIAYAFIVLMLIAGGGHFRRRYPGR